MIWFLLLWCGVEGGVSCWLGLCWNCLVRLFSDFFSCVFGIVKLVLWVFCRKLVM